MGDEQSHHERISALEQRVSELEKKLEHATKTAEEAMKQHLGHDSGGTVAAGSSAE